MRLARVAAFITIASLIALPLVAEEGRRPVWESPTIINSPGPYVLTRNLGSNPAPGPVIEIQAPHVDLDLNGFHIDNADSPTPTILVHPGFADVRIRNGTVTGGASSIWASVGTRLVVEDLNMHFSGGYAIYVLDVDEIAIRNNRISDTAWEGIFVAGGDQKTGIIEGNQLRRTERAIQVFDVSGLTIRLNQSEGLPNASFLVQRGYGMLIEQNTIEGTEGFGMYLQDLHGSTIRGNVIHGNAEAGLYVSDDCGENFILDNVVSGCVNNHGFYIHGSRNVVKGNIANSNGWCGFYFGTNAGGNVYGRNVARGNNGANCSTACTTPVVSTTDFCDEGSGNTSALDNFLPNPGM